MPELITTMSELCQMTGRSCPKNARRFTQEILRITWDPKNMLIPVALFNARLEAYNNGTLSQLLAISKAK